MLFDVSETGRKIRKDSFEAKNDMNFVADKLKELYLIKMLSSTEIPKEMEKLYNIKIGKLKCYLLLKRMGILRGMSESVSLAMSTLDYRQKILTPNIRSIIDGIVFGDGSIGANHNTGVARVSIGGSHKEFISYCRKLLMPYLPYEPSFSKEERNGKGIWSTATKYHPDLYDLYKRWYPNGAKIIPEDINLDKMTLLLWYLGDGSLSQKDETNARSLYFAANCFSKESIEKILIPKFLDIGIEVSRISGSNGIFIKTSSIVKLLNFMGGESPVDCYSYKFDIEEWRLKKTMKQVSSELNIDYMKLANWVKTGFVKHSRSPGGKKVVFSDDEFNDLKKKIECGELPREKHKRALRRFVVENDILNSQFTKLAQESQDDFLNRVVDDYYKYGFPYKIWKEESLLKEWYGLRKSQYIIPDIDIIKWRTDGLSLADYFHPHIFECNCKYGDSPKNLFKNRTEFKKCLDIHVKSGGILTFSGVHNAVTRGLRVKRVNNYSPLVARDIYNYYCEDGYKILDPCAGFSGRLIGASISKHNIEYTGLDPYLKTFYGLVETKKFINATRPEFKCNIINDCAETYFDGFSNGVFDFCFTSPPYFNLEEYSSDSSQSCVKYPEYDMWLELFLKKMMTGIYRVLKADCYVIMSIGKCGDYDIPSDLINISNQIGFSVEKVKHISFIQYGFIDGERRLEPLIILKK